MDNNEMSSQFIRAGLVESVQSIISKQMLSLVKDLLEFECSLSSFNNQIIKIEEKPVDLTSNLDAFFRTDEDKNDLRNMVENIVHKVIYEIKNKKYSSNSSITSLQYDNFIATQDILKLFLENFLNSVIMLNAFIYNFSPAAFEKFKETQLESIEKNLIDTLKDLLEQFFVFEDKSALTLLDVCQQAKDKLKFVSNPDNFIKDLETEYDEKMNEQLNNNENSDINNSNTNKSNNSNSNSNDNSKGNDNKERKIMDNES